MQLPACKNLERMEVCIHRIKVEIFFIYQTQDGEIAHQFARFSIVSLGFQKSSFDTGFIREAL